ncbi:MAG: aminotransferase class V-fold PLP-dependent enzyme [Clostridia bacterium]|nr:aminotransferase class V-fold PLP-dependent enzyme [Clostridia bacterium]
MEKRFVYADNAATTKVYPEVVEEMLPYFTEVFGNPSSLHHMGQQAKKALDSARARIADVIGAAPEEIFFTSCGTESDNWAIRGASAVYARVNKIEKPHIITTKIEHHAVLHTFKALENSGYEVTYVDVDENGKVSPDAIVSAIRDNTCLITVMLANNEMGTIEPVADIVKAVKAVRNIPFLTDAVQAVGNIPVNVKELGVDMLSFSGHKIHAPKGVGCLYIKKGTRLKNLIEGGGQEKGKRAGTEGLANIMGMAKALEISRDRMGEAKELAAKRDRLIKGITSLPDTYLTGHPTDRLPGNASFVFKGIEGESLLFLLSAAGICGSTGSACSSASLEPSHVLTSMGIPVEICHGSLRLSICYETTDEDIDYMIENVKKVVERLRMMSPIYN